ncbi:MAG: enoyl-CoA hydratase/isomerase family protein [Dehalococcoidia bacterium]
MSNYETMSYTRNGKIGYITFNRPKSLNAVNFQFEQDFHDSLLEFDLDDNAWVVIVSGTGRCFCAGADIKQKFNEMTPAQRANRTKGANPESYLGRTVNWKPVITAVHGYALGAGMLIAAESDLVVASTEAQFGITETKRGLPGGHVWAKMNSFMPSKVITEMLITGEPLYAKRLYDLGFINRLVNSQEVISSDLNPEQVNNQILNLVLAEAEKLANLIVDTPPLAARSGVRLSRNQWIIPAINADLYLQPLNLHDTEDFQEATKSFIEKRPPNYQAK